MNLSELATKYGTDKGPSNHEYTAIYEQYLEPLRYEQVSLLELGIGGREDAALGGASLRMWREYFTGTVVGLDLKAKNFAIPGVEILRGSQDDPNVITSIGADFGSFDVIIEDASHVSSLTIRSFELVHPLLKPGGLYIIEDTHQAYHPHYYGAAEAR